MLGSLGGFQPCYTRAGLPGLVGCLLGLVGVSIGISEGSIPRLVVCLELLHNELLLPVTPSILVSPSASSVCPSPLLLTNAKAAACYVHRMVAYFTR